MAEEWLKPSAAAQRLQMPASTLRVYSTKFATVLSPSASDPPAASDGRRGSRLYSSTDIAILTRAKELLSKGMTYEQVLDDLRLSIPGARSRSRGSATATAVNPAPAKGNGALSAAQVEAMVSGLVAASVSSYERMIEAWQSLAEERAKETIQLRSRIRELEEQIRQVEPRHNGFWSRLFGG